jgi:hypothetical protein
VGDARPGGKWMEKEKVKRDIRDEVIGNSFH